MELRPAAAELPGRDPEMVTDAGPPLVGQGLAVYEHQRGDRMRGDDRAGDDGLAGAGRRHQDAQVVSQVEARRRCRS